MTDGARISFETRVRHGRCAERLFTPRKQPLRRGSNYHSIRNERARHRLDRPITLPDSHTDY